MQSGIRLPLVSIAIPLFRSKRFLDCIVGNIDARQYPNLEIILSDRHCDDDAIKILRRRYERDTRFTFIKSNDRLDWVAHYNLLLRAASGKYFMWMPHDDSFPPGYITELVACLEEQSDAILAYGRIESIGLDETPVPIFDPPPDWADDPWSPSLSLRLLTTWSLGIPFRGVFRRAEVIEEGLFIRSTYEQVLADAYWVFALSLKWKLCFVASCVCVKRIHQTSTYAQWRYGSVHLLSSFRVLRSYVDDLSSSRKHTIYGTMVIFIWLLLRAFLAIELKLSLPGTVMEVINWPLRYVLSALVSGRAARRWVYG